MESDSGHSRSTPTLTLPHIVGAHSGPHPGLKEENTEGVYKIAMPSQKEIPRSDVHYTIFRQVSGDQRNIFQQYEQYLDYRECDKEFDKLCDELDKEHRAEGFCGSNHCDICHYV